MTVIAWDGKTIAADRQATSEYFIAQKTKLFRLDDGTVLGFRGYIYNIEPLMAWYIAGAKKEDWPLDKDARDSTMVVVERDGTAYEYEGVPHRILVEMVPHAWGSGRDVAIGAMSAGADACKAVEIACKHNTGCGEGMDFFHVLK